MTKIAFVRDICPYLVVYVIMFLLRFDFNDPLRTNIDNSSFVLFLHAFMLALLAMVLV